MIEGYFAYKPGEVEPSNEKSRSFWHGWMNRKADCENVPTLAQRFLANQFVRRIRQETGEESNG